MVATEFIDLFNNVRGIGQAGILDFSDKLNTIITISITIICMLVVTAKQYFQGPLSCYTATKLGGANIDGYINNYCWVEGTYVLPVDEALKVDQEHWEKLKKDKIMYYQWVPFVLALQCVLFIIPRYIWSMLTYNRAGTELERLVTVACEGASADPDAAESNINQVAQKLEQMIMATRETNQGTRARLRHSLFNIFGCLTFSKRMGTWTVAVYFFMKIVYLGNSVGQIYLMQRFLGLHRNYTFFGTELARNIIAGQDWKQTYVFPRVTFCRVPFQQLGNVNYQTSQCVLGINYIYEKIFIFLWFWLSFVSICTLISIPIWYIRMSSGGSRVSFIKKNLLLVNRNNDRDRKLFGPFTRLFLRHDGVFLLRMLALNAGDYITSQITARLFDIYKDKLVGRNMFDDRRYADSDSDDGMKLDKVTPNGTLDLRGPRHETSC